MTNPNRPGIRRAAAVALDLLGVALWLALAVWVTRVARTPAEAAPVRDLLLMMGAVYALARLLTVVQLWFVPAALLTAGTVTAVWSIGEVFSGAGGSLLGYANAAAAFQLACVAAGLMAVARLRNPDLRVLAAAGTLACAFAPWLNTAITSALLALVLPVALVARHLGWRVRGVVVWSAVAALAVIAGTTAVAATYDGKGPLDWLVAQTLSGNRGQLWAEALDAAVANPMEGVGTSRFSQVSGTAGADLDLRWAHNAFLQIAAETGFPGMALALSLLVWAFTRLWVGGRDAATGVAAAGLAAMVVAASIDYVWHFPAVALATAAIAGAGGGVARSGLTGSTPRPAVGGQVEHRRPMHIDVTDQPASRLGYRAGKGGPMRDRDVRAGTDEVDDAVWPRPLDGSGRRDL